MAGLFISYARIDGSMLAHRLEQDLTAHGHSAWLDRAEIEVSESWSAEIEAAIDGCEALIAVLTAGAAASRVCRGEQLRALRKGKRVVPLLAQADADRPVYLEPEHYLSFAENDPYEARFAELLDYLAQAKGVVLAGLPQRVQQRLAEPVPPRAVLAALREPRPGWEQVLQLAAAQQARFMEGLAGRAGAAGVYEPAVYVPRVAEEAELARFTEGDARALLLIGEPGVGKTNLLCHWALAQAAARHAVLLYACERLTDTQVLPEIAKDTGLPPAEALPYLDGAAANEGRQLIVVVDGLNDFRSDEHDGQRALLGAIDTLVAGLVGTHIRIIVSCTSATWNRLDRQSPLHLTWPRYHRPQGGTADFVALGKFSTDEAEAAYPLYRARFNLLPQLDDLAPALRQRLREPVLLRLLAEALRSGAGAGAGAVDASQSSSFDTMVFRRYFEERVRSRDDQSFVDALAGEMLAQRSAALPVQPLTVHPVLGPIILQAATEGSYARLLDEGVLTEVRGDLFTDDLLKFSYPLVGAYAIVRRLMRQQRALIDVVRELAALTSDLPLAWEAAVTLIGVRGDAPACAMLAGAPDPELRELAHEGLARMHAVSAERARAVLGSLLDSGDALQQRCALRAAFSIGPAARELLVRAALSDSELLRHAVRDTLYLIWNGAAQNSGDARTSAGYFIWRHAPDFTHGVMRDLVEQLSWTSPIEAGRILTFVLDLTITIYVNHCDRADVVRNTSDLFHHLAVDRLHIDTLAAGGLLERTVFKVVSSVFADRLLRWMLVGGDDDTGAFFARPPAERHVLIEAAALLDPAADVQAARGLLLGMLRTDVNVVRGTAALVLAVHALARPDAAEPLLRSLFDELGGDDGVATHAGDTSARLWLLAGLSVLMQGTPATWVPLLEALTQRLVADADAAGTQGVPLLTPGFDALYVPLGLGYGKVGGKGKAGMPMFERMLAGGGGQGAATARLVAGLGPVGFYHPQAVLALLRPCFERLAAQADTRAALVSTLATMRSLHYDPVDAFLADVNAGDAMARDVAAAADMERVQQFMRLLGYYNNAVHFCVNYPRMRRGLAASALTLLAEAGSAAEFVSGYAQAAVGMARDASFVLTEWTLPEPGDAVT
jgi:hypothetical protein